jgi:hypothetical protein
MGEMEKRGKMGEGGKREKHSMRQGTHVEKNQKYSMANKKRLKSNVLASVQGICVIERFRGHKNNPRGLSRELTRVENSERVIKETQTR